jgi:hypothetical protein
MKGDRRFTAFVKLSLGGRTLLIEGLCFVLCWGRVVLFLFIAQYLT